MLTIIVSSLVHSIWLYSHFASLSLSLYRSFHLPHGLLLFHTIVSENKPPSSFTLAWLTLTATVNLLTLLRYYYLISSPIVLSLSFHLCEEIVTFITPLLLFPSLQTLANFEIPSTLLEREPSPLLPSPASSQSLLQMFATFFSDKILKLHSALKSSSTVSSPHIPPKNTPTLLSSFSLVSEDEVTKIISHSSNSFSDLDPNSPPTMPICTPTYLDYHHKPFSRLWYLSGSIQILFCHSSSQEIQS